MSSKLTTAYVVSNMNTRLGGSRRSVELTEEDYTNAMEQALDLWNEFRMRTTFHRQDNIITAESSGYSVDVDDDVIGVRRVYFLIPYQAVVSGLSIFELTEKLTITRMGIQDIALTRSYWDQYRQIRGVEPQWHFDKDSDPKKIWFYAPSGPYTAGFELYVPFSAPTQIEKDRDSTFMKLVEGYSRMILGEIRSKFGNQVLSPGGGSVQLNGQWELDRGTKLIDEVTEVLRASRPNSPVPIRIG